MNGVEITTPGPTTLEYWRTRAEHLECQNKVMEMEMRKARALLMFCCALFAGFCLLTAITGCQTVAPRMDSADIELLVVHAETTLSVAETSYDAWSRVAAVTGMPAVEVAMRRAQWEGRIALLRGHLDWLRGQVAEREAGQ